MTQVNLVCDWAARAKKTDQSRLCGLWGKGKGEGVRQHLSGFDRHPERLEIEPYYSASPQIAGETMRKKGLDQAQEDWKRIFQDSLPGVKWPKGPTVWYNRDGLVNWALKWARVLLEDNVRLRKESKRLKKKLKEAQEQSEIRAEEIRRRRSLDASRY